MVTELQPLNSLNKNPEKLQHSPQLKRHGYSAASSRGAAKAKPAPRLKVMYTFMM